MTIFAIFVVLLAISLGLNAHLFIQNRLLASDIDTLETKVKELKKAPAPTIEAQQMLAEIASGSAVLKIEVLDAAGLLYRRPQA